MFGSKREHALEEELAVVRKENERRGRLLSEIAGGKEEIAEQFARMMASYAQIAKDVGRIREQLVEVRELADSSAMAAGDVRNAIVEINNGVGTFDVNHSLFVGEVKKQDDKIATIVESNKHFTTPMKYISELPVHLKEEQSGWEERARTMAELSKSMSVLALNAAIEAGRMGESGSRFVSAAEEIRIFSERYEREARELAGQLSDSKERTVELEEQVHHLSELLKENNISMGRLYKDALQSLMAYEGQQMDIRKIVPDSSIGRADALQQSQQECGKAQERILGRMDELELELKEYKNCADELEAICKSLFASAAKNK